MNYLGLAEIMIIAEEVTGVDRDVLVRISRVDLLDSALAAPSAGFGDYDLYPSLIEKAAVLGVRVAMNHPLPDGNKRLAWMAMVVFLDMNNADLETGDDDAVEMMMSVARGEIDERALGAWLSSRVRVRPSERRAKQ